MAEVRAGQHHPQLVAENGLIPTQDRHLEHHHVEERLLPGVRLEEGDEVLATAHIAATAVAGAEVERQAGRDMVVAGSAYDGVVVGVKNYDTHDVRHIRRLVEGYTCNIKEFMHRFERHDASNQL